MRLGRRKITIGSVLLLATGGLAHAVSPVSLSWEDCVREASRNSPDLRASKENLRSSEYLLSGAWSPFFPQVSAALGYAYGNSSSLVATTRTSTSYTANVSATETIFSGLQDKGRLDQARANTAVSRAALDTAKARTSFDLKSAFEGLVYSQSALRLSTSIVQRREENLRLVELRYQSGRENKGSFLLSKAYLAQARLEELQAGDAISVAEEQLARVLGRDDLSGAQLTGSVPVSEADLSLDLRKLAVDTPDHRQAVAQEEGSQAAAVVARGGFFPSLSLTGQVGRQGEDFFPQGERWSVGLNLNIPLFSGGKDYYATRSAYTLVSAAALNRESVDRQLLVRLRQAFSSWREAIEKLKVDESFYAAASTRAEIAREKYNNGLLSFEDWDVIENDLILREKNRLQSRRDRVVSEASWEQALGKGVIP